MTVHVVGAGLAGLSAACTALRAGVGRPIVVYEAAPAAGGRCRSWHDRRLDAEIDNGTHVVLGANAAVRAHVAALGSDDELAWLPDGPDMYAAEDGVAWRAAGPGDLLRVWRRLGGPAGAELATALRLLLPFGPARIGARFAARSRLAPAFWDPLARAVMNTPAAEADAAAFARVLRRTILRGPSAMRVAVARRSLARCLVDPALAALRAGGAAIRLGARLRAVSWSSGRPARLHFGAATVELAPGDGVVLALPPWDLDGLLPPGSVPRWAASAIVNLHVRVPATWPRDAAPILAGFAGRTADWALLRGPVASVTTSAADALIDLDAPTLARRLWADAAPALGMGDIPLPPDWRVIKERRATPRQTPGFAADRAAAPAPAGGIAIAGDWTMPGLPCTIETALASGEAAARRALAISRTAA
jgi:hypothetical protein